MAINHHRAVAYCLQAPNLKLLIVCNTFRDSRDVFLRCVDVFRSGGTVPGIINYGRMTIEFNNGSVMIFKDCADSTRFQGLEVSYAVIDDDVDHEHRTLIMSRVHTHNQIGVQK
jgi:hypothetical protein